MIAAECEQLVVGQEYLVPCINGIPVVGEPHVDNDHFNITEDHYHCDSRFHDERNVSLCAIRNRSATVLSLDGPKLEPRVCIRDTPLPFTEGRFGLALMSLYADYGFTVATCGLCPHKGMPIQNGRCSGHRLEWLPDGTIKYKPPYVISIRGTCNTINVVERTRMDEITFNIVQGLEGRVVLDMQDHTGFVFISQETDLWNLRAGDQVTWKR